MELGMEWVYQTYHGGTKRRLVEKKETCQYLPLIPNLEALLQNEDLYKEVCMCFRFAVYAPIVLAFVISCRL